MTPAVRALVPIRSFSGMTRLSGSLDARDRARLARALADRTTRAASDADTQVSVITADAAVRRWAIEANFEVVDEPFAGGLDLAAARGVATTGDAPWIVVHSDLPAIGSADIRTAAAAVERGPVLAPSHDGGTSLIGGTSTKFPFHYGPGSFRRHLAATNGEATILIRPGLALDLDHPWDLRALRRLAHL